MVSAVKCLAISDVHGNFDALREILELVRDVDLILLCGDFSSCDNVIGSLPPKRAPVLFVKGDWDRSPEPPPRKPRTYVWLERKLVSYDEAYPRYKANYERSKVELWGDWDLEKKKYKTDNWVFCSLKNVKTGSILLTHRPPARVALIFGRRDPTKLNEGAKYVGTSTISPDAGEERIRRLIIDKKPEVVVCGHVHGMAFGRLGDIPIFDVAPAERGAFAILDLENRVTELYWLKYKTNDKIVGRIEW